MVFNIRSPGFRTGHRINASTSRTRRSRARKPIVEALEGRALLTGYIQYGAAMGYLTLSTPANPGLKYQHTDNLGGNLGVSYVSLFDPGYLEDGAGTFIRPFDMRYAVQAFNELAPYPPYPFPTSEAGSLSTTGTILSDSNNMSGPVYIQISLTWMEYPSFNRGQENNLPDVHAVFNLQGSNGQSFTFSGTDNTTTHAPGGITVTPPVKTLKFSPGDTFTVTMTGSLSTDGNNVQGGGELEAEINVVPAPTPDVELTSLTRTPIPNSSPASSPPGINFSYMVSGDLAAGATIEFYWASGDSLEERWNRPRVYLPGRHKHTRVVRASRSNYHSEIGFRRRSLRNDISRGHRREEGETSTLGVHLFQAITLGTVSRSSLLRRRRLHPRSPLETHGGTESRAGRGREKYASTLKK